ncbi:MAG: hypothetical protein SGPRY_012159, partial [Prymnesium sp.]
MHQLLLQAEGEGVCAGGEEGESWMARVHALNLLRRIFLDRALAVAVTPFLSKGFLAAFHALEASRWDVRNSGLLLLAAMIERALRQRRSRDERSSANGIGIRDFFSRAPELYSFLLRRLDGGEWRIGSSSHHAQLIPYIGEQSYGQSSHHAPFIMCIAYQSSHHAQLITCIAERSYEQPSPSLSTHQAQRVAFTGAIMPITPPPHTHHLPIPPSLQPITLPPHACALPSRTQDAKASALSLDALLPRVQAACSHRSLHVRLIGSRALLPLLPPTRVEPFLATLAISLLQVASAERPSHNLQRGSRLETIEVPNRFSHNRLHGLQLQMIALLNTISPHAHVACAAALASLRPALWLLLPSRNRCPTTCAAMAQLLGRLLDGCCWADRSPSDNSCLPACLPASYPPGNPPDRSEALSLSLTSAEAAILAAASEVASVGAPLSSAGVGTCRASLLVLAVRVHTAREARGEVEEGRPAQLLLGMLADEQYEVRLAGLLLCRHACGLPPVEVDDGVPIHDVLPAHDATRPAAPVGWC